MPIATRTFRVFVSSTFEDLKVERDALQQEVFPKLRTLCEQHGARFQAIDLRWGVRDEAALDQQTMAICLREIQRCKATRVRPNFIALLGDRYGWRPLPVTVPAAEFEALSAYLPARDAEVALRWYRLDENAVPPEYCLQPRTGEFVAPSAWNPVEESLLEALTTAARAAGRSEEELIKYEASATHQEILAGLGETDEDRQHVFGFVRRPTGNTDPRLDALKSHLRVHEFDAGDMKGLCELVLTQLTKVIEAEVKRFEDRPPLDLELEAHNRFAEERCRIFIGRESVLDTIEHYLGGPERRPLVLHGESGSGKSAVMAKASQEYKGLGRVIRRFIGASPESASGHALLTSICRQIAPGETPVDYAQLENVFRERLLLATAEQPLVFVIDALDQLAASDPARGVTWLPLDLPAHVKVIVSTTDSGERLPEGLPVRLERMTHSEGGRALDDLLREARRTLQPWQRESVLAHFERCGLPLYLKLAAEESKLWRSYTPRNVCVLGEGVAGIIDTLFDRLSSNANYGPVLVERSLGYLAAARYGLTEDEVLDVLTADDAVWTDFDRRKHHQVSERRLPVVVWSRFSLDLEPYLTERVAHGGTVVAYYHRQLTERAKGRYLTESEARATRQQLAEYFTNQECFLETVEEQRSRANRLPPTPRPVNLRKVDELLWICLQAEMWDEVERHLTDPPFLEAKTEGGLVFDLSGEFAEAVGRLPENRPQRHIIRLLGEALRSHLHFVDRHRTTLFQCVWNSLSWFGAQHSKPKQSGVGRHAADATSGPDEVASRLSHVLWRWSQEKEKTGGIWLRSLRAPQLLLGQGQLAVLSGHEDRVSAVRYSPAGTRIASAGFDRTLRIWNPVTGEQVGCIRGHEDKVLTCAFSPDGKLLASGADDGTVRLWELGTWRQVSVWRVHPTEAGPVYCVAFSPDGTRIAAASGVGLVWNSKQSDVQSLLSSSAECLYFAGHKAYVYCVAFSPDGRCVASGGGDRDPTIRIWDAYNGAELMCLRGHGGAVRSVVFSRDGRFIASASHDKTVRYWDLATRREVRSFKGHTERVEGVAISVDGLLVASGSSDNTVRVWSVATGKMLTCYAGHENWVHSVDFAPDGRSLASGSNDRTVRIWDAQSTLSQPADLRKEQVPTTGHASQRHAPAYEDALLIDVAEKLIAGLAGTPLTTIHEDAIVSMVFSPDGKRLATGARDSKILLWDVDDASSPVQLGTHLDKPSTMLPAGMAPPWITSLAFSPDGRFLAAASLDGQLSLRDAVTGHLISRYENLGYQLRVVKFSPDGSMLLTLADTRVALRDAITGTKVGEWVVQAPERLEGGDCAAFSDDGNLVAAGFWPGVVAVWDWKNREQLACFQADPLHVEDVAFSPDATVVVATLDDDSTWAWNLAWNECWWQKRGTGDARRRASNAEAFPWYVSWSGSELAVVSSLSGKTAAWTPAIPGTTPGRQHVFASHPSGRKWAFAAGSNLSIVQLESDAGLPGQ